MAVHICKFASKLNSNFLKSHKCLPILTAIRKCTGDPCHEIAGKREHVGFGINGSPIYFDAPSFPMPAIRFREPTEEMCALREKEKGDWKELSITEKKMLYRYSFCQTYAEMTAPNGEWKAHIGVALWGLAVSFVIMYIHLIQRELPKSFEKDARQAQLKRMIALEMNPITGIASKWDYEVDDWK